MNNLFNLKRFGLVLRKDLMEDGKRYLLLFLTIFGIMTISTLWISIPHYLFVSNNGPNNYINHNQELLLLLSLLFATFGLLFAATFMSPMNNKVKRISYLISPASNLEKYLSRWILMTVGYIFAFFIALWLADALRVGICTARFPELDIPFVDLTKLIHSGNNWHTPHEFIFSKWTFALAVSIYFLLQSLFILGSTFWEKATFVKTFTAGALIVCLFVVLYRSVILLCYGDFNHFGNMIESFLEPVPKTHINEERALLLVTAVISLFTLLNWTLSYFRLRESEITKRL